MSPLDDHIHRYLVVIRKDSALMLHLPRSVAQESELFIPSSQWRVAHVAHVARMAHVARVGSRDVAEDRSLESQRPRPGVAERLRRVRRRPESWVFFRKGGRCSEQTNGGVFVRKQKTMPG